MIKKLTYLFFILLSITHLKINGQQNFTWAKAFGSAMGSATGKEIITDDSANVYSTGYFSGSIDFDPGPGVFTKSAAAAEDIYISKLDSSGNFLWIKTIGKVGYNEGRSIAVDLLGNVYIAGYFADTTDFDPGVGVFNLVANGGRDIFILKLNPQGNFMWAKSIGGTGFNTASGINLDASGNVYTTGYFEGTADFDPGAGIYNLSGWVDVFVLKLDANGDFIWARSMEGGDIDYGSSLAIDSLGNVYTTGSFNLTVDFDPSVGVYNLTSNGDYDIFISKLDVNGNFVWAKSLGSTSYDKGRSICLDEKGHIFTAGSFRGYLDWFNLSSAGSDDAYIAKLDTAGNLIWAKKIGGGAGDHAYSITTDTSGNVYTTGCFGYIADFDPGPGTHTLTAVGINDVFISKLDSNGNFMCATAVGSTGNDYSYSICTDNRGSIYTTGDFSGTADFDANPNTTFSITPYGYDAFVYKVSQTCLNTVGIKNGTVENNNMIIYPNPASTIVNIAVPNSIGIYDTSFECIIFDSNGKQLFKQPIKQNHFSFDVSKYNSGMYFIVITDDSVVRYKQKLIIE